MIAQISITFGNGTSLQLQLCASSCHSLIWVDVFCFRPSALCRSYIYIYIYIYPSRKLINYSHGSWVELEIFVWRLSCGTDIFIKTTPTHTYIYKLFYYIQTFLFDKLYIYTHPTKKKKNLVFLIKIMFDDNFS